MTITAGSGRMDYMGNGNTPTYSYNFKIFNKNHLSVTVRDTTNTEDKLIIDTDYTVSGVGDANGGSITLTAGNLASNYHLTIREFVPIEQVTDLRNQGDKYNEVEEDTFDYLVKIDRQQQDEIDRSFKLPVTITGVSAELPIPEALKFTRWNSLATALENMSLANLATIAVGNTLKLVNNQLDISAATSGALVTNGDDHNHSGGDGSQIDHTTLSNKGTNTHTQIDTAIANSVAAIANSVAHIANITSNPHAVDKTDVGLSDVTNNAQVKVSDIGTTVLAPTGDGSGLTGILTSDFIINKTSDYTLVAADLTGRKTYTNYQATGQVNFIAPTAVANNRTALRVVENYNVNFVPEVTDSVFIGGTTLSPYTTGTISVSNGSPTVTGSGTTWTTNVKAGDSFRGNGGGIYIIQSVDSNTQITLTSNHSGALSGVTYGIGKSVACKVIGFEFIIECYTANKWVVRGVGVQPSFSAYMSAGMSSFTINTDTLIVFNTEHSDNMGEYTNTAGNYKYTPSIPGMYRVKLQLQGNVRQTETVYYIKLFKTGSEYKHLYAFNPNAAYTVTPFSLNADVSMNGTDYLQPYIKVGITNDTIEITNSASSLFEATRTPD